MTPLQKGLLGAALGPALNCELRVTSDWKGSLLCLIVFPPLATSELLLSGPSSPTTGALDSCWGDLAAASEQRRGAVVLRRGFGNVRSPLFYTREPRLAPCRCVAFRVWWGEKQLSPVEIAPSDIRIRGVFISRRENAPSERNRISPRTFASSHFSVPEKLRSSCLLSPGPHAQNCLLSSERDTPSPSPK